MWIPGPITTVHNEHSCRELVAVARIGLITRRWLSDKNRSAAVVLGNHPNSVGETVGRTKRQNSEFMTFAYRVVGRGVPSKEESRFIRP
jgi:hypothetical protein